MLERKKDQIQIIENPRILHASDMHHIPFSAMAENYRHTWARSGIFFDQKTALNKILQFNPKNILLLTDVSGTKLFAQLYTSPLLVDSIQDFVTRFPTYRSIEKSAAENIPENPNIIVCFSLNCTEGFRVVDKSGKEISLARAMLTVPQPKGVRKIAYSFIPNLTPGTFPTGNDSPVAMHEALGGIRVADLINSRPEHALANGHNVIVIYPINQAEQEKFSVIKKLRQENPENVKSSTYGPAVFFEDVSVPFARQTVSIAS